MIAGLRSCGARIEYRAIDQHQEVDGAVLLAEFDAAGARHLVAFDNHDHAEIDESIADRTLIYFKSQYDDMRGYDRSNVVPGGYFLANNRGYRYLPLARALRSSRHFDFDVYGRFGLRYGGFEIRRRAVELLAARHDFRHEVSLFKYPGGPEKVPYRRYLFEISRAKVCVDMPGNGDLCTRLVDYLAVGSCVVGPRPSTRLPVQLVDGIHIVYCEPDLSDLGDICAELVRDERERERIAHNARTYFDRHLRRSQLSAYHLRQLAYAAPSSSVATKPVSRRVPRALSPRLVLDEALAHEADAGLFARSSVRGTLVRAAMTAAAIMLLLVAVPEIAGDRPYDPRPSAWLSVAEQL